MHTFLISVHNFYFVLEIQKNRGEFTGFLIGAKRVIQRQTLRLHFPDPYGMRHI